MRPTRGKTSAPIVKAARNLRQQQTPSEVILWEALRNRRLAGLKFRRQHPFGRFSLDFYCLECLLVVEIDGAVHNDPKVAEHDLERTKFLEQHGIRVLRVAAEAVETRLPEVLGEILEAAG